MRKSLFIPLIGLFCLLMFFNSCASYRLQKNLDPESREFISKVRYIITKEERKEFLNLPPSDRQAFIEEFWRKRDTDPDTEENEYKEEYFNRIDEANRLFTEGGPGWLQDRGRIYILFGAPWEREAYPRGITFYGKPTEIWYYGYFPVVFIDHYWNGNYKLEPLSPWQLAEINKTQMDLKEQEKDPSAPQQLFAFDLAVDKVSDEEVIVRLKVPYKNIWFEERNDRLETILAPNLEILDDQENRVWEHTEAYPVSLSVEELTGIVGKDYVIEVRARLTPGDYSLVAELENQTDGNRAWKKINFSI